MDLFWITDRIAVATRPRGGDWLANDLAEAHRQGVGVVVSCLTPAEEHDLGLDDEERAAQATGLRFMRARMEDRGTPPNTASFRSTVADIASAAERGRVVVHCRQGLGRAPLVVASILVHQGSQADDAWALVARKRERSVPDTEEQREWLRSFAAPGGPSF